eukprot:6903441-Prymnesium_polylepis.1
MALSPAACAFEYYDLGASAPLPMVQERRHELVVSRAGVLNCLGCFLWVDLGAGQPFDGVDEAEADAFLEPRFPFGDHSLPAAQGRCNEFTSLCSAGTLAAGSYASNWQNPLLLLPSPAFVRPGDRVVVRTHATAHSTRPSYMFEVGLLPAGSPAGAALLGRFRITFDDLYPDYGDV